MKPEKPHPYSRKLPPVPVKVREKSWNEYNESLGRMRVVGKENRKRAHYIARCDRMRVLLDFYARYEVEWAYIEEKYKLATLPRYHNDGLNSYYQIRIELQND